VSMWLTVLCAVMLIFLVPNAPRISSDAPKIGLFALLRDRNLTIMNATNFLQKCLMTTAFLAIPVVLLERFSYPKERLWVIYLVAMGFAFVAMGFSGSFGERRGLGKRILLAGVALFAASYAIFALSTLKSTFVAGVVLFFVAFSMHEPIMQSMASKFAKSTQKGEVLGIFNSAGFLGSFAGGLLGGYALHADAVGMLCACVVAICALWALLLARLTNPGKFRNIYTEQSADFARLANVKGVIEVYQNDSVTVIKYNERKISSDEIWEILGVKNDENLDTQNIKKDEISSDYNINLNAKKG